MCLYPTFVKNPKYKPNKKNKGKPPVCKDRRLLYIPTKCGCCIECRKEKQMESQTRRRTAFEFWVFHYIDNKPGRHKRNRRKDQLKMGRKPERNSNKRIKTIFGKGKKRNRKKHKTLVRYRTGREKRQNTFARYLLRSKIGRTYKKTLEIRVCIYRRIL